MDSLFALSPKTLGDALASAQEAAAVADASRRDAERVRDEAIRAARAAYDAAEHVANEARVKADFLARAAHCLGAVTDPIRAVWARITQLEKKTQRTNITVATLAAAKQQLEDARKELMRLCRHPIVLREDGSEGSRSYDYDDGHPGSATCILCGFYARDEDWKDTNRHLPDDGSRIVRRWCNVDCGMPYHKCRDLGYRGHVALFRTQQTPEQAVELFFGSRALRELAAFLGKRDVKTA